MGGLDPHAANDEKPDHTVTLHAFWMDKLEVTNGMYNLCVKAGVCRPPVELKSETRDSYFGNAAFNDYPVVYVTWDDANTYCKWADRRLPTEAEWERAARGGDYRTWPWGDEPPDPTFANFNYQIGDTSRVGSYPDGASPFGIFDMAGNVAEWVSDFYNAEYYRDNVSSNPTGPETRIGKYYRVVRGGSYQDAGINIRVAKRSSVLGPSPNAKPNTTALTGDVSPKIGFRCASDD
jgi:formylglycine-generating enzyme required for sulfatase activity